MNVLLLEDDNSLGATLKSRLDKEGLPTTWVNTIELAKTEIEKSNFSLIILDVGLPDGSGFEFSKLVRKNNDCPFIFVTAQNSAEDRLAGYELGAVEYIPKPFHLKEFLIRVKNVLQNHGQDKIDLPGGAYIDFMSHLIFDGQIEAKMSAKEATVLKILTKNSPNVVSRDQLLNEAWGEDQFPSHRTVDNIIVQLRSSLGNQAHLIKSVRGVGYLFKNDN